MSAAIPPQAPAGTAGPDHTGHYSYTAYADPQMAESFDRIRFGGPIGGLLLETQERVLLDFLGDLHGRTVLDVGTGTGRAALTLARAGATVTGVDASREMLRVAGARARADGLSITFQEGDAHALAFPDASFDAAISLRVLMHTPGWRVCLGELCRVARDRVVFDYPALASVALLQSIGRRVGARFGRRVEAYRVFRHRALVQELARHGFAVRRVHRQFVLPIALHKVFGSRRFTEGLEAGLAAAGLLRLFGSPVTVVAERCRS
ncbi:MAG: class I SAM-dependent methyltransferase [Acidobacteriota bacterium]|nr:class I SAM-dependent methyltransferase [Acidobacteriota bacterium]